jgi:tetratricopeptide (TPR) repeat protein
MSCADPIHDVLPRLAVGELDADASRAALEHVERCADCSRELDFLADLLVAAQSAPEVRKVAPRRWAVWIAGLAAAAALVLYLARDARSTLTIDRSVPRFVEADLRAPDDALARAFTEAMAPYTRGEFDGAIASLSEFLKAHPDHGPARFYRGIAEQESGDVAAAAEDFRAVGAASTGYLGEHAQWRLANLFLSEGRRDEAAAILRALRDARGEFAPNAARSLDALEARD